MSHAIIMTLPEGEIPTEKGWYIVRNSVSREEEIVRLDDGWVEDGLGVFVTAHDCDLPMSRYVFLARIHLKRDA